MLELFYFFNKIIEITITGHFCTDTTYILYLGSTFKQLYVNLCPAEPSYTLPLQTV